MPQERVDHALEQLANVELIFRRGTPPDAEYTFKHALVQDAAYSTLLRSRRQQLHGRIAATLEGQFAEFVAAQPQLIAHHCTEAGLTEKAVNYWLKAGQQAFARSAMMEAVSQLQKGLNLLPTLSDSVLRQQLELDLQISSAQALLATRGYAAPAGATALERARALAEQLDRRHYLGPLLHALWALQLVRGELGLALSLAEQMETFGEAHSKSSALLLGKEEHGICCFWRGEFSTARECFAQCHGMSDPAHRAVYSGWSLHDQHDQVLLYLANTLACQGYVDQARARVNEALTEARELRHSLTLAVALACAGLFAQISRSAREAHLYAKELTAVSNEHGFGFYLAVGTFIEGHSLAALGQAQDGLNLMTNGLSIYRATGAVLNAPTLLTALADTYGALGRPNDGLTCLEEAAPIIDKNEERWNEADMLRSRGELQLAAGNQVMAEASYHQALAVATRQGAKTFELRAATSLARLWRDQGKRKEARELLAPVYGWFTEGFDTLDLKEAKALLEELGA
jgi:tetratricopeptide (TPR) repeat protein